MNAKLLISAIAAAAALSVNTYADNLVNSTDANTIAKSYGRAGGLVGSDRVSGLQAGSTQLGIAYDADVAARTNMPRAQGTTNQTVGINYDADVAARTNMQRAAGTQTPHQAAAVEGQKAN
jgi:hypothetical protein